MGLGAAAAAAKKKAQRRFKLRGFTLKVDALDEALAFVSRFPEAEDEALDLLIDEIDKESRTDLITLLYRTESHFFCFSFAVKIVFFCWKNGSEIVNFGSGRDSESCELVARG